ncbi:NFX1-type zinc finger-containing protein 1 [Halocaridina rubra]|uniref:NFX1-type zinc finger-containing protein 1 n=1 Tax=Halocaridina rubra TaxID=373956 RepID=A0AAN8X5A4_HALRR
MRPEISQLLVPSIYPTLKDHKSVHQHPHIRGMEKDIFFFTHDHHEEQGKDENSSKANSFEAEFIMALCQHIMLQGYSSDDVTVLTPYSGQFFLLKKIQCKYIQCHNVRISIVDSFQGEESNIIFLSLVRSNEKGNIGFLKKENRVCVALSRAKHGMYIVGSINSLKQSSDLWKEICKNLSSLNAIGNSMTLKCENHPEVLSTVKSGKDIITSSPQGGCTKPCSSSLPKCGHNCPQLCHIIDMQHEFVRCPLPCPKLCQRSHPCPLTCGMKCKPCTVQIPKLLSCEHILKVACSTYEDTHTCCESLEKILPECKHKVVMKCSDDPAIYQCQEPCKMDLSCGHKCTRHCHGSDDPYHLKYECLESCPRSGEGCAMHHVCPKKCFEDCGSCVEQVEKIAKCGHTNLTKCSTPSEQIECTKECKRPLPCGHFCSRKCKDPCEECLEYVTKTIKECQHKIQVKCSEDVDKSICPTPCTLTLPCGHKCQSLCKEPCTVDCQVHVNTSSSCPQGHKIKVPCFLFNKVSGEEAWQFCLQPCSTLLDCKHYCEGNCSLCLHGRVHVTCRKKCEKRLVCGHK